MKNSLRFALSAAAVAVSFGTSALAVDEDAAKALAKKSDCTKCHAVEKSKKGPSFQKVAAKWKGKGLFSTYSERAPTHIEGGKGQTSKVVHFQIRPDPLAN